MPRESAKCKFSEEERVEILEFFKSKIDKENRKNKLKIGAMSEAVGIFQCHMLKGSCRLCIRNFVNICLKTSTMVTPMIFEGFRHPLS